MQSLILTHKQLAELRAISRMQQDDSEDVPKRVSAKNSTIRSLSQSIPV